MLQFLHEENLTNEQLIIKVNSALMNVEDLLEDYGDLYVSFYGICMDQLQTYINIPNKVELDYNTQTTVETTLFNLDFNTSVDAYNSLVNIQSMLDQLIVFQNNNEDAEETYPNDDASSFEDEFPEEPVEDEFEY